MNRLLKGAVLGLALLSLGVLPAAAAADAGLDKVVMKDGRVISGLVVEETQDKVTLRVQGTERKFSRSLIKSISYGTGEASQPAKATEASALEAVPQAGAEEPAADAAEPAKASTLQEDLAIRYNVPLSEVVWVRKQGIPESELAMVFFVAARARVVPGVVVQLRLSGWDWSDIESHFGIDASRIYYVPGPWYPYPYYHLGWGWGWGWGGGWGWRGGGWHGGGHHWR
jgi:hypothetical protein